MATATAMKTRWERRDNGKAYVEVYLDGFHYHPTLCCAWDVSCSHLDEDIVVVGTYGGAGHEHGNAEVVVAQLFGWREAYPESRVLNRKTYPDSRILTVTRQGNEIVVERRVRGSSELVTDVWDYTVE